MSESTGAPAPHIFVQADPATGGIYFWRLGYDGTTPPADAVPSTFQAMCDYRTPPDPSNPLVWSPSQGKFLPGNIDALALLNRLTPAEQLGYVGAKAASHDLALAAERATLSGTVSLANAELRQMLGALVQAGVLTADRIPVILDPAVTAPPAP